MAEGADAKDDTALWPQALDAATFPLEGRGRGHGRGHFSSGHVTPTMATTAEASRHSYGQQ